MSKSFTCGCGWAADNKKPCPYCKGSATTIKVVAPRPTGPTDNPAVAQPSSVASDTRAIVEAFAELRGGSIKTDWYEQAAALSGYDPAEFIRALKMAFNGDFWPKRLYTITNVVKSAESILVQYRQELKQASRENEPPSLQRLREMWPDTPKQTIAKLELEVRLRVFQKQLNTACKICDDRGNVPSKRGWKDAKGKPIMVPCYECSTTMKTAVRKIWGQIQEEVNGSVVLA